ncbi:MAG: alkaline phosphatase family protein [Burkholderiales bacterium]
MSQPDDDTPSPVTRRDFLKSSSAVAGAALLSSCGGGSGDGQPRIAGLEQDDPLLRFDHLVVLMFENRSLDNVLGWLYPAGAGFDGLAGGNYANPVPSYIDDGHASVAARRSPGTDADMQNPNPDPGEPYPHVNTQLFGTVNPPTNQFESAAQMKPPYNAPPAGQAAAMQGFVQDYCNTFVAAHGRNPTFDEYRVIMDAFTPEQLPVISTLAKSFAVYDAWFCAVPSQTYCNRSFFHASSSSGYVMNAPHSNWYLNNFAPTVFNRLQDAGRSWRVYYDESQLAPLTALIHAPVLAPYFRTNFATMQQFYADVANGNLPDYAFIEPRMLFDHNDMHPPGPLVVDGIKIPDPSDVRCGDLLLHQVYDAIRTSKSPSGSNALNTLLLVTFDEHGGCYDHVPPPAGPSPQNPQPEGQMGFFFDRLGVRVPAVAVSAHTAAGSIVKRQVHHAAAIRTLSRKFNLPHLTERDRGAPDLADALNLASPRDPSTWPVTVPPPQPPGAGYTDPTAPAVAGIPLNDLQRHIVATAMGYFTGVVPPVELVPKTVGEAYATLKPLTAGKFGAA